MRSVQVAQSASLAILLAGASFGAAQAGQKVGWVWANQPSAEESYAPPPSYSFNSSGGVIGVSRSGTGTYNVVFLGLGSSSQFSNVLVSAYGGNGWCKVGGWGVSDASVSVLCFDADGNAADSLFTMLYQSRSGGFGSASKGLAFLWANQSSAASYTPDSSYQYNSTGGVNTITRSGVGHYEALLPGLNTVGGTVQVTAYGAGAGRCKVEGWGADVDGQHVTVLCFNSSGAASDEVFTLAYANKVPVAYLGTEVTGLYGWFNKSKGQNYKLSKTYRFNSLGSDSALIGNRSAKGSTSVDTLSTPTLDSSNMLVTAYGDDNSYCNVTEWFPLFTQCYGQGGHAKDSQYDVSFQNH